MTPPRAGSPAATPGLRGAAPGVLEPASYEEMAEKVREAEARRETLVPAGLGNHLEPAPPGAAHLSLRRLDRVLRYEPGDFTIGVQAGLPLESLRSLLATNGQEVPVDFPALPGGTVGGALAQNRCGPRRGRHGSLRNYLIGVCGMRGGGRQWRAGGMVVKNVAGYDVMKLVIGSRGHLGPILEANLKLRPLPAARSGGRAVLASGREAFALAGALRRRALDPAVLSVLAPGAARALDRELGLEGPAGWSLVWTFEGNRGAVEWLSREARVLVDEARPRDASPLEAPLCLKAVERLSALREVGPTERELALVVSLAVLPGRAAEAAAWLEPALEAPGADPEDRLLVCDAASGLHVVRLRAPRGRPEGSAAPAAVLERCAEAARRFEGTGEILAAPAALLAERGRSLLPASNPRLAERIRRTFDPHGVFGPALPGAAP